MSCQLSDKNYKKLSQKAADMLNAERNEKGSVWLHKDGRLWNISKTSAFVFSIINTVLMTATLIGLLLTVTDGGIKGTEKYSSLIYDTRITAACLILLTVGFIFHKFKKYIISCVLFAAETAVFIPSQSFRSLSIDGAWKSVVFFTLPTALLCICAIYIIVTEICDKAALKHCIEKLITRISATHPSKDGELTTEEQWNEYIDEFISDPIHIKPKKSLKIKEKKTKK